MNHPSNSTPPERTAPSHGHSSAPDAQPMRARSVVIGLLIFLLVFIALGTFGILRRMRSRDVLAETTNTLAAPTVIALEPKQAAPVDEFVLPGNVTAFTDSPIYARTSGYLTHWYFDIGGTVKKGDLLAEISTPELDQQLLQAQADLKTAEATANNARVQAERYTGLVKSEAVSQQDTDTFVNQANATSAAVKSAQANVQRLKELQSFEKIYAPFDGVVTARNVDIGQLIDTGTNRELFHLQALNVLRVYTNVPQVYSNAVKRGDKIDMTFAEYPGRRFQGNLVRTAEAIDPVSRTLLVEIDVNNNDRKFPLLPGALAQVHFRTPPVAPTFVVPVSALIFRREGLQIGTVIDRNSQTVAHIVPVTIGQDDGATVQVISGLNAADRIIQDPPDSLIEGERVTVVNHEQQKGQPQSGAPSEPGGK
ncbi:MAG TPA: efflux RND transporter periplasmic adaptor subunit [Terracidiphilus sp.]|nr:efflux RND transporter periplasmic adaptor subunit [Terracidiphilus sp.]